MYALLTKSQFKIAKYWPIIYSFQLFFARARFNVIRRIRSTDYKKTKKDKTDFSSAYEGTMGHLS